MYGKVTTKEVMVIASSLSYLRPWIRWTGTKKVLKKYFLRGTEGLAHKMILLEAITFYFLLVGKQQKELKEKKIGSERPLSPHKSISKIMSVLYTV